MITQATIRDTITTDRLHIKKLKQGDHEFIKSLVNSKGWIENIGERNIHSKPDSIAYINKILRTEDLFYWVVSIKDSDNPIGIISFIKRSYLEHFDIGFAFLAEFNGKGYAYEATRAVLTGLPEIPLFRIILATTKLSNLRSIKLLVKLGFNLERQLEVDNQKLLVYRNEQLI